MRQQPQNMFGDLASRFQSPLFTTGAAVLSAANNAQPIGPSLMQGLSAADQQHARAMQDKYRQEQAEESKRRFELSHGLAKKRVQLAQSKANSPRTATYGRTGAIFQDKNGQFYTIQFGSDGNRKILPLQPGMSPSRGVTQVDEGTGTLIIDSSTGDNVRRINKNIAGAETEKIVGRDRGEKRASLPKSEARMATLERQHVLVDNEINNALSNINFASVGLVGSLSSLVPGTPAYNLKQTLETIKANIGFDKLQEMRENSPTGGALGQVAVQELKALQSVLGNLEQAQSGSQFRRALLQVKDALLKAKAARRRAYQKQYRQAYQTPQPPLPTEPAANGQWSIQRVE